ncbi:uncharacterized protein LOC121798147 [Salvia splendens]|uniref:uncharacterized protein LOC121798147 n=1 Tax=Salvia splendens TaxID=180675 RepID=UPI001C26B8D9|nr:uncharacterized protein LOC121798147 [Salvia splendens]
MAGSVSAEAASGAGGMNGDDDTKSKQAQSKSDPNRKGFTEQCLEKSKSCSAPTNLGSDAGASSGFVKEEHVDATGAAFVKQEENADATAATGVGFVKKEEDVDASGAAFVKQEESAGATAATGVGFVKKEEDVDASGLVAEVDPNLALVEIDPSHQWIDDYITGVELLFTEEQVEALGVPTSADFFIRSSFDNQDYPACFYKVRLHHGSRTDSMFQLAGPIWDALEHPIQQKIALRETLSFCKEGDVLVCY